MKPAIVAAHPNAKSFTLSGPVAFAAEGKVNAHIHKAKLADINRVFSDLKAGTVDGRIVIDM